MLLVCEPAVLGGNLLNSLGKMKERERKALLHHTPSHRLALTAGRGK